MRTLALMILPMGIALTAGHARAQTYDPAFPVCLYVVSYGASPYYRCSYTTMDQCRAFANGQMCSLNPYYAGATAPVRRNNRRCYRQVGSRSPAPAGTVQDTYCLQGQTWGYPGNCQFSSYAQCMATASGTDSYCGINPQYAHQRNGTYRGRY